MNSSPNVLTSLSLRQLTDLMKSITRSLSDWATASSFIILIVILFSAFRRRSSDFEAGRQSEMPTNIKVICSHAHQWHVDLHQDRCTGRERSRGEGGKKELLLSVLLLLWGCPPWKLINNFLTSFSWIEREEGEKKNHGVLCGRRLSDWMFCRQSAGFSRTTPTAAQPPHSHTLAYPASPFCLLGAIWCCAFVLSRINFLLLFDNKIQGEGTRNWTCCMSANRVNRF